MISFLGGFFGLVRKGGFAFGFRILTESGDAIITEGGDNIVTEAAP